MDPMNPTDPWNPWIWQNFKSRGNCIIIGPGIYFLDGIVQNFAANNSVFWHKSGHSKMFDTFFEKSFSKLGNIGHKSAFGLPAAGATAPALPNSGLSVSPPCAQALESKSTSQPHQGLERATATTCCQHVQNTSARRPPPAKMPVRPTLYK